MLSLPALLPSPAWGCGSGPAVPGLYSPLSCLSHPAPGFLNKPCFRVFSRSTWEHTKGQSLGQGQGQGGPCVSLPQPYCRAPLESLGEPREPPQPPPLLPFLHLLPAAPMATTSLSQKARLPIQRNPPWPLEIQDSRGAEPEEQHNDAHGPSAHG